MNARSDSGPERLLTVEDVAGLLQISRREVWRREKDGRLPRAVRLSSKLVRWRAADVEAFVAGLGVPPIAASASFSPPEALPPSGQ